MRYFFEISYHGKKYHGWQRQKNAISVQQVVEDAMSLILNQSIVITGSGRTDTGVHCKQQFFHADLEQEIDTGKLRYNLNSYLPEDISINAIFAVNEEAHARFTATSRSYEYYVSKQKNPFYHDMSFIFVKPMDITTMNQAASLLIGEHDFESFSKVKTDVNNFWCNITEAVWMDHEEYYVFHISANRFLRGMVRAIVGTLFLVGSGKLSINDFQQIINNKNRRDAGAAAPPQGLFLTRVVYPEDTRL
ncbi:tRNA pseudouridine(38-40) synthase TruA [Fulvivirga sediminis]|uniref:tRNA pseudouridine synthase A n=1 Tax=Fulvivirga sediminis TaxID=2803949 RepID=A0A937F5V2_9BACT|nr:tRNA pseudouridine(38-40) synthase TruA [Fulvivirga sediminis]MBL3654573.1 tRNA pseudouridine(38-40) synthase TruA [Fulvivirga sediminis]